MTDTFDFDAFGTLVARTGTTPNAYLYCGEQFDEDLGLYYNRARYLNTDSGRFWTRDVFEGFPSDPLSLHKYLYAHADPIGRIDPSGKMSVFEMLGNLAIGQVNLRAKDARTLQRARRIAKQLCHISAVIAKPLNMAYSQVQKLTGGSFFQAHHVTQDAAMRDMFKNGYKKSLGFAIPLLGGSKWKGSPHAMANQYQIDHAGEPIYEVAEGALKAAGCSQKDAEEIVEATKNYNDVRGWIP